MLVFYASEAHDQEPYLGDDWMAYVQLKAATLGVMIVGFRYENNDPWRRQFIVIECDVSADDADGDLEYALLYTEPYWSIAVEESDGPADRAEVWFEIRRQQKREEG